MQPWHWGHFLQVGNAVIANWKAGDAYAWDKYRYHLACNSGWKKRYIIAADGLKVGNKIMSTLNNQIPFNVGNAMPLGLIPEGLLVHNIELKPGKGAQLARSAGAAVNLLAIDSGKAIIKLNSGEIQKLISPQPNTEFNSTIE